MSTPNDELLTPPADWRRAYWDPMYGHPWQGAEADATYRARRLARWNAALSDRDRARIRALADQLRPGYSPARLDDLDAAGLAVGVCATEDAKRLSGERIGSLKDGAVAVLVWVTG